MKVKHVFDVIFELLGQFHHPYEIENRFGQELTDLASDDTNDESDVYDGTKKKDSIRKYFPETWIFENFDKIGYENEFYKY